MHASVGGWFAGVFPGKQRDTWRCAKAPPRRGCVNSEVALKVDGRSGFQTAEPWHNLK